MRAILESFVGMAGSNAWKGIDEINGVDVARLDGTDSAGDDPVVEEVFKDRVIFGKGADVLDDVESTTTVEALVEDGAAFVLGAEAFGAIDVLRSAVELGIAAEGD